MAETLVVRCETDLYSLGDRYKPGFRKGKVYEFYGYETANNKVIMVGNNDKGKESKLVADFFFQHFTVIDTK